MCKHSTIFPAQNQSLLMLSGCFLQTFAQIAEEKAAYTWAQTREVTLDDEFGLLEERPEQVRNLHVFFKNSGVLPRVSDSSSIQQLKQVSKENNYFGNGLALVEIF